MSTADFEKHREARTAPITMPDGSERQVCMPHGLWEDLENLKVLEGITSQDLVPYAEEEMELQDVGFDWAFACVVDALIKRYTP